jgi:hypothetical protein
MKNTNIYVTPKFIKDYLTKHNLIKNPPYDVRKSK